MKTLFPRLLPLFTLTCLLVCAPARAALWYVSDAQTDDSGDGTTWSTAKKTIQAAITLASSNDTVLVTNGIYATGGQTNFGAITNRVVINKPITVLAVSGPTNTFIRGAGSGAGGTNCGNSAVRCVYVGTNAVLAGFTLTNGYTRASGTPTVVQQSGGGAWCETSATLSNCIVTACGAWEFGGGVYRGILITNTLTGNKADNEGGGAYGSILTNCTVTGNTAPYGGGASACALSRSSLSSNYADNDGGGIYGGTATDCTLTGNDSGINGGGAFEAGMTNCTLTANSAFSDGGGIWGGTLNRCVFTSNSADNGAGAYGGTLTNCTLQMNAAYFNGGGAYNATLRNCTLATNRSDYGGGAWGGTLNNCIVSNNTALLQGGGVIDGTLVRCTVTGNTATNAGGGTAGGSLDFCTLRNNRAGIGGGASRGTLNDCTLAANTARFGGGASSGTLSRCVISNNTATSVGAGVVDSTLYGCTLTRNSATTNGGGAAVSTLYNCMVLGNTARSGGGAADGILKNCTVVGNLAGTNGGGVFRGTNYNCIIYSNSAVNGLNWSNSISEFSCTTPLPAGPGNIAIEPIFVTPGTGFGLSHAAGDYRLRGPGAPCINSGTNGTTVSPDWALHPRIEGGTVDMGAMEYGTWFAATDFVAYNDAAWHNEIRSGSESNSQDVVAINFGTNSPAGTTSGLLIDSASGQPLPITVTLGAYIPTLLGQTMTLPAVSEAGAVFGGHIGTNNVLVIDAGDVIIDFTGLETNRLYRLALWCTRGASSTDYSNRWTQIRIDNVVSFVNNSSAGSLITSVNYPNDAVRLRSAWTDKVACFDHIRPQSPGIIKAVITRPDLTPLTNAHAYLNAFMLMTEPVVADTDSDGIADNWEQTWFTSLTNANATSDADSDHLLDWQEYVAGTQPKQPASLFEFTIPAVSTNDSGVVLRWRAESNRLYNVYWTGTMRSNFVPVVAGLHSTYPTNIYTDTTPRGGTNFYRIGARVR